ncbi:MAG: hypothetical protein ABR974_00775 [Bacteroidales bacterium]|jgi:fatty acid desaturase
MDEILKSLDLLFEKAVTYSKTGIDLARLRSVEKISDVASSLVTNSAVFILIVSFMFFLSLGLAFWLGDILGKTFYGLLIVAGFYGICGFVLHFFMHKGLKGIVGNYFIKMLLK